MMEGGSSTKLNTRSIKWQRRKRKQLRKEKLPQEKETLHLRKRKKQLRKKRKKQLRKEEDSFFFNRKLNLSFLFLKNRDFISNNGVLRPRFLLLSKSNKEIMDQKNASR